MNKRLFVLVGLVSLLSGCTMPDDEYDYIETSPVTVTASPLNVKVGEAVEVTLTASVELDERSRVPERPISDITMGMCFSHISITDEEGIADPHGFCFKEMEVLPPSYKLLDGTEYYKGFDDMIVQRGERHEFKHTFTFTLTEVDRIFLNPHLMFMDEFLGPSYSGNLYSNSPRVTFE